MIVAKVSKLEKYLFIKTKQMEIVLLLLLSNSLKIRISQFVFLSGDYNLIYEKLPRDIADRYVFLMDPIIGTGRSASRCIEVSFVFFGIK